MAILRHTHQLLIRALVRRLTLNDPSILDLNYDVLQYLLRHMGPTRDTLHFAMTSRAAYKFAIPQYLSRVVLDCRSRGRPFARHRAAGFCKFILADDVRSRALRELVILGTAVDIVALDWEARDHYDVLQGLGLVFTKAHLLRSLSLSHSASLFSAMPWLPDLIAGLTHLRMLRLGCALAENVSGLLAQAQKSCRVLSRASLQLFVHRFMDISKDLGPAVYPIVDTLFVYGELHGLESIADKFPNIETLYLLPDSDFIANQHAHSVPEDKWTRLDYVSTVTPLPRMRTVRHLRIDYLINPGDGDMNRLRTTGDRTASMIRAMRPVVVDCFMSDTVLRLLGEHATDLTVIRLRIKNTTSGKADKADLETMTNGIVRVFAVFCMLHLSTCIRRRPLG